jgi:hypothetical protein
VTWWLAALKASSRCRRENRIGHSFADSQTALTQFLNRLAKIEIEIGANFIFT